jgi:hypothetical protein
MGQAWNVDIRVKSFAPEAAGKLDFLCAEYGFTGPEVVSDEAGTYPLLRRVRYQRTGLATEISLVLSYMGEELSLPNSYLRMVPDRSAAHRSVPARRTPAIRCAACWTGRLRPCGAYSGTNPSRTFEPYAA